MKVTIVEKERKGARTKKVPISKKNQARTPGLTCPHAVGCYVTRGTDVLGDPG